MPTSWIKSGKVCITCICKPFVGWNWPPISWIKPGEVRITYICTCGKKIVADFPEGLAFEAQTIVQELAQTGGDTSSVSARYPALSTVTQQKTPVEPLPMSNLSVLGQSSSTPSQLRRVSAMENLSARAKASQHRFLLLCVDTLRIGATGIHLIRLSNIEVASTIVWNDQLLFNKIRNEYYLKRPRKILSLHSPKLLYFVRVSHLRI